MTVIIDTEALRHELARRGLTAADFARISRVSPATLSHAFGGRRLAMGTVRSFTKALAAAPVLDSADAILPAPDRRSVRPT